MKRYPGGFLPLFALVLFILTVVNAGMFFYVMAKTTDLNDQRQSYVNETDSEIVMEQQEIISQKEPDTDTVEAQKKDSWFTRLFKEFFKIIFIAIAAIIFDRIFGKHYIRMIRRKF